jgi:hypothetical protein
MGGAFRKFDEQLSTDLARCVISFRLESAIGFGLSLNSLSSVRLLLSPFVVGWVPVSLRVFRAFRSPARPPHSHVWRLG